MTKGIDEKAMLTSLARGSRVAFTQVFDLYHPSVYTYARKYLRSTEEAEEATQDVFIRIWDKRECLFDVENFSAYLFSVKKHIMARRLKYLVQNTSLDGDTAMQLTSYRCADDEIRAAQVTTAYHHALDALQPHQLRVFKLVKEEQMSYEQVGLELKISTNTVKFHMKEAFRLLRQRLKPFAPILAMIAFTFDITSRLFREYQ